MEQTLVQPKAEVAVEAGDWEAAWKRERSLRSIETKMRDARTDLERGGKWRAHDGATAAIRELQSLLSPASQAMARHERGGALSLEEAFSLDMYRNTEALSLGEPEDLVRGLPNLAKVREFWPEPDAAARLLWAQELATRAERLAMEGKSYDAVEAANYSVDELFYLADTDWERFAAFGEVAQEESMQLEHWLENDRERNRVIEPETAASAAERAAKALELAQRTLGIAPAITHFTLPQPLETNSRTDLSQPIERSEVMKPNQSQQQNFVPGAHASITGTVERKTEFERMTAVTVRSDLADGYSRYNQVLLFDAAARRVASAIEDGATVRFDARVHENVFPKGDKETYRTDVISRRIDREDPGAAHEATLTVTGEVRRGFLANDKVTMGSIVSESRDGEPRYHSFKAFDEGVRGQLETAQVGDRLTLTGTIGQNSYEKDGEKVYTTDIVIDRVAEHTPAPRQAPAPLPTQGNDHRQEHRQTNRPH